MFDYTIADIADTIADIADAIADLLTWQMLFDYDFKRDFTRVFIRNYPK
jgi:hypothetical protein